MVAVVHHGHADSGEAQAHQDLRTPEHPAAAGGSRGDEGEASEVGTEHDDGFRLHAGVGLLVDAFLLEVGVDPLAEGLGESGGVASKADGGQFERRLRHECTKLCV